ncbi:patched domain-containing protein 3-like [Diadema antillarum]|uniref:patched domain-containing protein 3-like n=1 Tax=Diadema antillarum TaxID=105358 RepID=UPI003A87FFFC
MAAFDCIERGLSKSFTSYGKFIARWPFTVLIISLMMAAVLGAGIVFIRLETDSVFLFAPDESQARDDADLMDDVFPVRYDEYLPSRGKGTADFGANVIVRSRVNNNVLVEDIMAEILRLDKAVRNITIKTPNGTALRYSNLCSKWQGSCLENPVLQVLRYNASRINDIALTHPVFRLPNTSTELFIGASIGDVSLTDEHDSKITRAGYFALNYYLQTTPELETSCRTWENTFIDYIKDFDSNIIMVSYIVSQSLDNEMKSLTLAVFPYFTIAYTILFTFAITSCAMADWVFSKAELGSLGILSASLAIASSVGLLSYVGASFNLVVASMPFLIIGLGLDDMFIMLSAWRKTSPGESVEERMGKTYSEAAVSITITSITDALAFGIGSITPLPAIRIFCLYTGVAVIFDYIFQITFFGACMAYSGRREAANRHCLTLTRVIPRKEAKSMMYKIFCAGGLTQDERVRNVKQSCETAIMAFFRDSYGPAMINPFVKVATILAFGLYLGGAIYGCFNITEGLELKLLASDGSSAYRFFEEQSNFFSEYGPSVSVAIHDSLDYSDANVQRDLDNIVKTFEDSHYVHSSNFTEFWLRDYVRYLKTLNLSSHVVQEQFHSILVDQFLKHPAFLKYNQDIKFKNTSEITIEASRFIILGDSLVTTTEQMKMMADVREKADNAEYNLSAFAQIFIIYEQYASVRPLTIQNLSIAVACMFLVALILIPHPFCAVMVTVCIISIQAGIIGYMSLWDVRLDGISMINIILCIGFSVDFSAHITYSFLTGTETYNGSYRGRLSFPEQRAVMALYSLGMPILQGAVSTIVAMLVLIWSPSYIFRTFFKIMFMVMLFGMLHSLVFLPTLLSCLGGWIKVPLSTSESATLNNGPGEVMLGGPPDIQQTDDKESTSNGTPL